MNEVLLALSFRLQNIIIILSKLLFTN